MFSINLYSGVNKWQNIVLIRAKDIINGHCANDFSERRATIGGTFDNLHEGHRDYIGLAFEFANYVRIFVTSDNCARSKKVHYVQPYEERVKKLEALIQNKLKIERNKYEILTLYNENDLKKTFLVDNDPIQNQHVVIVSPEYTVFFQQISRDREALGLKSLLIVEKERTKNHNHKDISSSAIRNHSIEEYHVEDVSSDWDPASQMHRLMIVRTALKSSI